MRGGLERWKRGAASQGVRQAMAYAFQGSCDSHVRAPTGVDALAAYSVAGGVGVLRYTVEDAEISVDRLDEPSLRRWVDGCDPSTGERRGRDLMSPDADLVLDGTINAPKSYSIAALLSQELAVEFEALQDRLRDRIILMWQRELNARRGAGGRIREDLRRIEVVELRHRRSRALDPHIHRHLWLNVKVQGVDGKWSNIDSRVAMKMHTGVNAEGELAARTDPRWIAALARHGFTVGGDGEIEQLAHAVRPLSRRSNQIEANRAVLLAAWRQQNPGAEPGPDELRRIDRLAWARSRPNKPGEVDEHDWEAMIVDELTNIDPHLAAARPPVALPPLPLEELDLDLLAARAIVEADERSASSSGRFSMFDVRAGATRAIATAGVVADRSDLQSTIDEVTRRALALTDDLLPGEGDRPAHVKAFMASATAALKVALGAEFDRLATPGIAAGAAEVAAAATEVLEDHVALDDRQLAAAGAIAGTDRLVSVTGPAGAGKTTMLRVARRVLNAQGRRMLVVAPTKKAASVAGREIGAAASSLHALLSDHGWRWARDAAGAEQWFRLQPGQPDPATGRLYPGPRRFPVAAGDRIVVDEAGMVDLRTAHALAVLAQDTGAGIAMVGDHLQARPVGHSGAMASLTRRATAIVELAAVHRFDDPGYAQLTLRMRNPHSREAALAVAAELDSRGLIRSVADKTAVRDAMVDAYLARTATHRRVALVTGTNDEADAINEAIQQRRVDAGELSLGRITIGQGEQRILEGDVVQTRRNDRDTGVENRALWAVRRISADHLELASISDRADIRRVSLEYAADHVHLAYASTVHGIQGETTDESIVGPGVDAAGLYVGMTRGRTRNEAIVIARRGAAAREQIADSMLRGVPEVSVGDSVRAARAELSRAARANPENGDPSRRTTREETPPHGAQLMRHAHSWLKHARAALLEMDARIASGAAHGHGRPGVTVENSAERDRLAAQYASVSEAFAARIAAAPAGNRRSAGDSPSVAVDRERPGTGISR